MPDINTESLIPKIDETQVEPAKKKRSFWWYVQFPIWFFCFVGWFGIDTLLFQNIPLLMMLVFVFGVLYLINRLTTRCFDPPPKPKTWRALKFALVQMTAFFCFFFLLLCVMRYWVPPVSISKETTYITEPRTVDGLEVDLVRAIDERFAPKGDPEDNGFRTAVSIFGTKTVFDFEPKHYEDYSSRFRKRLDLPENEQEPLHFQDIYAFFKTQIKNQELPPEEKSDFAIREKSHALVKRMTATSWKTDDFENTESWLTENAEALKRFAEAVRMPTYYVPPLPLTHYDPMESSSAYEGNFHRSIVRSLQCRIMNALAEENIGQAIDDTESILKLANHLIPKPISTTQYFVSQSIQSVGLSSVRQIIKYGNPTKEQIEELRKIVQANSAEADPHDLALLVRFDNMGWLYASASGRILDTTNNAEERNEFEHQFEKLVFSSWRYVGWNPVFRRLQKRNDQLEAIVCGPISRNQYDAISKWNDSNEGQLFDRPFTTASYLYWIFRKGCYPLVPEMMGEIFCTGSLHSAPSAFQSRYRGTIQLHQTEIVLELELFRLEHGNYPKELNELNLNEIQDDPFANGEPFRYSQIEKELRSGYVLYSVGPNGVDDGGFNKREQYPELDGESENEQKDGDDVRIFMLR